MTAAGIAPLGFDLSAVVDSLPVGLAVVDPSQRIVLVNPAFHASLGLESGRFAPGTGLKEAIHALAVRGVFGPGDPDVQTRSILDTERGRSGRLRHQTETGRSVDLYNTSLPDGGAVLSAIDITDVLAARTNAETALGQTATALATLRIGLAIFHPDGDLLLSNPRFADLLGLPPERLTPGAPFSAMLDLMEGQEAFQGQDGIAFVQSLRALRPGQQWTTRRQRDNQQLIDVMVDPLPDGGCTITVNDVTPLAAAEDDARRRAHLLDSVLFAVPHGICVYGPDRRVSMFNQTYLDVMAGAPLQIGDHLVEVIRRRAEAGEYGEGQPDEVFVQQMSFDIARPQTRRRVRPNGSAIDVRTAPLPDGGHISVVTDISALVQAESEARHAKDVAEAANKAKSRFLATMSHELRTPLNAIIGFSDALMRDTARPSPAEVAEYGSQINAAGKQLLSMINTILDVARIESGRFEPGGEVVDVGQVLRTAVRQAQSAAQAAELSLELNVPDDLPRLRADERRVLQVITQLLSNAIKFTEAGGSVLVEAEVRPSGELLLRVADTGIGIPEADLERVFEPFTQLDDALSRRYGGTGLGLYVARAIVSAQGGQLTLTSQPRAGTTAEVVLPIQRIGQ